MKIALIGATGLVGSTMLRLLEERNFPITTLLPVASERSLGKKVRFKGKEYPVVLAADAIAQQPELALFSAGGGPSLELAPLFAAAGCYVVDNSSAWRMDPSKKLVVPEVNGDALTKDDLIIANPNCSTIQMVMALKPLHDRYTVKRVVVSTYQSVTGTGQKAVDELLEQRSGKQVNNIYPYPIDFNLLPQIDVFQENGYTKEEMKMVLETCKIMGDNNIKVTATCVRVPVMGGHSESLNIEFAHDFELAEVRNILGSAPGIMVQDNPGNKEYPMPLFATNRDEVFVGRLRRDESQPNTLNCWIVADNLRKGAATNAIQIAELLLQKGWIEAPYRKNRKHMQFKLQSEYQPAGDQPGAIKQLVEGINEGETFQTLLGVTGSGKTFTMANVIQATQKPTLILTHNKTLVAQLYGEFRQFFPDNSVEYFVSYYDYYQPEAYIPTRNVYIEKDLAINEELEKLRLRATSSLLSGRRDIIVVASVSCIYGMGNPTEYENSILRIQRGENFGRNAFLHGLVHSQYMRSQGEFARGTFRVNGDTVDINLPYLDFGYRITFFGDEIEEIERFEIESGKRIQTMDNAAVFPANLYIAPKHLMGDIIREIQDEMNAQVAYFAGIGKNIEAQRIKERVNYDLEMIQELGFCKGIENYSRFLDRRRPGVRPFCLLDYFPDDYLMLIDESHVTIPQISGMYGGDRSRKLNLVDFGFRLPSALDNRPLNFNEFEQQLNQVIFVSATPANYELQKTGGVIAEQVVRPTGLLDPPIEVRPSVNQIDDLLDEIDKRVKRNERVLVTTLTKRMAEELDKYLSRIQVKSRYIHSEVDTLDRVEILRDLRLGNIDVLVGVNLLREGLDLPEVTLMAILDADKEGFLRNERSLTQMAGRAARNSDGLVIFYADTVTESMQRTIDETERRREKQMKHNSAHNITPTTVRKSTEQIFKQTSVLDIKGYDEHSPYAVTAQTENIAAEDEVSYDSAASISKAITKAKKTMEQAAKNLDFMEAAKWRDELLLLEKKKAALKA